MKLLFFLFFLCVSFLKPLCATTHYTNLTIQNKCFSLHSVHKTKWKHYKYGRHQHLSILPAKFSEKKISGINSGSDLFSYVAKLSKSSTAKTKNELQNRSTSEIDSAEISKKNSPSLLKQNKNTPAKNTASEISFPYARTGIGIAIGGLGLALVGGLIFEKKANSAYNEYDNMTTSAAVAKAIASGIPRKTYIENTDEYRKDGNTYKKMAVASYITGGAVALGGLIFAFIPKKEKNIENITLYSDGKTIYTEVGFSL